MRKKIFTILLALATSVGMMWAQGPWTSGDCTLTLDGGVMTVSGNGAMADYYKTTPWDSYKSSITSIVIEDGVTHVGNETFCVCENLVSVTIGNDVVTIGSYAFDDCYKFTTLTLGNSIQSIGECAFMWSKELTELNLPASLQIIGNNAFLQCKKITTVTIPSSVTSIGSQAFYNCIALTSIYTEPTTPPTLGDGVFTNVPTSIPLYVPNGSVAAYQAADQWNAFDIQGYDPAPAVPENSCGGGLTWELSDGVLTISYDGEGTGEMNDFDYEYDDSPVNVAPWKENKSDIATVVIGDGVKSIGNYAFNDLGENFTAVTIANSVEHIGMNAFMNDKDITEMTLPSSLKTIDTEGLANCGFATITIPSGVTSIGTRAFCYCMNLTSLTCEATTPPTLGTGVFSGIKNKQNIPLYVPSESVDAYTAASQWNAFDIQGEDPTPSNVCGDGLTWEYNSTTNALTISYDGTGTGAMYDYDDELNYAPWISSYSESITSVIISNGVTSIGQGAFLRCQGLTSVTIPNSVTSIGGGAFMQCIGLTSVTIPNSVASIGQAAFAMCSNLETVTILAESLVSYGANAFYGTAEGLKIYVPAGSVDTYKAAWTAYADKIEAIPGDEPAEQVITWDNDFCSNVKAYSDWSEHVEENNTKDGITVTYSNSTSYGWEGGTIYLYYQENILTFTSTVGDISKIEVYYSDNSIGNIPNGWTNDATNKKLVWEGTAAAAVDMVGGYVYFNVDHIVFTIAGSTPTAVENVQTNEVQASKFFRDGQILILRDGKTYTVQGWQVR